MSPLGWLILGTAALRLAMAFVLGLGIDESYMVAAGRDFQLGYFDHPPLSWWLSAGAAHLFGSEAAFVVRLPFIGLFAASTWLMHRLTSRMFNDEAGLWAAVTFNLAPVFGLTSGGWVLPDGPLICALLGAALCLVEGLRRGQWGWWIGAGLCAGLAMLSKYSASLVMLGAFVAIITVPGYRKWLARPQLYVAVAIAAMVFAPVPIWNALHGWASFAFQGGRAAAVRFRFFGPVATLGGEALFLLPWIWFALMAVFLRGLRAGPRARESWLMCWLAFFPIALFAVVSWWSRNVLFHWAAPGYLFLFPLLGAWMREWRLERRDLFVGASAGLIVVGLAVVALETRWNFVPWEDPALQALDWKPLRGALAQRGLLRGVIAAPSWSDTGKVDYALGGEPRVLCLNVDSREYGMRPGPETHIGEDVLIVAPRQTETQMRTRYAGVFERIETIPPARFSLPGREVEIPLFIGRRLMRWP